MDINASVKNLINALRDASPAYNEITQMFFILPQRSLTLLKMYPEIMEKEDMIKEVIGIRYSEDGSVNPKGLGYYLSELYHELFKLLSHPEKRRLLLELAGLKEEEFKEFDPLRSWIEVSLEGLSKINKDALKLLDLIVSKLTGKKLDETVYWEEIERGINGINFKEALTILRQFYLLPRSPLYFYVYECPLVLDAYSDLRGKLKDLVR